MCVCESARDVHGNTSASGAISARNKACVSEASSAHNNIQVGLQPPAAILARVGLCACADACTPAGHSRSPVQLGHGPQVGDPNIHIACMQKQMTILFYVLSFKFYCI